MTPEIKALIEGAEWDISEMVYGQLPNGDYVFCFPDNKIKIQQIAMLFYIFLMQMALLLKFRQTTKEV